MARVRLLAPEPEPVEVVTVEETNLHAAPLFLGCINVWLSMRPTQFVWIVTDTWAFTLAAGVTGRKNVNYHTLKGRACQPLKQMNRAKLKAGFAAAPSAASAAEQLTVVGCFFEVLLK
eukprot:922081-Amphidinium_carterae.3